MEQLIKEKEHKRKKRIFILGDEWLYFKLYTGYHQADEIIKDCIYPLISKLFKNNLINEWFFIRYKDTDQHLRIRIKLNRIEDLQRVIQAVNSAAKYLLDNKQIWKIQFDMYDREMERYGENTIELIERYFYHDSVAVADLLRNNFDENVRWKFALLTVDHQYDIFKYPLDKKLSHAKKMRASYVKEMGGEQVMKYQLDKKYRQLYQEIKGVMDEKQNDNLLKNLKEILNKKEIQVNSIIKNLFDYSNSNKYSIPEFNSLISSINHMSLNRIFREDQRLQELVIYDILAKYYLSKQFAATSE